MMNKILIAFLFFALTATTFSCSSTAANTAQTANTNAAVAGCGARSASQTAAPSAAPEALIADLYKQHDAKNSPFFQTENRARVEKYFTKATADMIWQDAVDSKGEVGALGADPLYDAQDTEIKKFAIGKGEISGGKATVRVAFENFGEKQTIDYLLAEEKGVWKIEDIKYSDGRTLREAYREQASADSAAGSKQSQNAEPDVFGYFFIRGNVPEFADISEIALGGQGEYGAGANPPYHGLIRLKTKKDFALLKPTFDGDKIRFKTKEVGGARYEFDGVLLKTDYTEAGGIAPDEVVMRGTLSKISKSGAPVKKEIELTWSNGD